MLGQDPGNVKALFRSAQACRVLGDLDRAGAALASAEAAAPGNKSVTGERRKLRAALKEHKRKERARFANAFGGGGAGSGGT